MSDDTLLVVLRIVGVSHIVLAVAHVPIWRAFGWTNELSRVTPLTARVFAVQTFFVAFALAALGALVAWRPDMLVTPSDSARVILGFALVFWTIRLAIQAVVFDPVLLTDSPWRQPVRILALLGLGGYVAIYAGALARQFEFPPLPAPSLAGLAQAGVALVWLVFGVGFKLLRLVPRHERIVARVLGETGAPVITRLIGAGEACIGAWMLSGVWLVPCAVLQTILIAAMNVLELRYARDLLLAPIPMVVANVVLLTAAWYAALAR